MSKGARINFVPVTYSPVMVPGPGQCDLPHVEDMVNRRGSDQKLGGEMNLLLTHGGVCQQTQIPFQLINPMSSPTGTRKTNLFFDLRHRTNANTKF